jgi:hypothetical protein
MSSLAPASIALYRFPVRNVSAGGSVSATIFEVIGRSAIVNLTGMFGAAAAIRITRSLNT